MVKFTDIFIRRPVLAMVISLLIFVLGLSSLLNLPIQQYPQMENTVITVTTNYPGANPSVVQGFISSPIEKLVASAEGVDYVTSDSTLGVSTVTAFIKLNFDPNVAFTSVSSQTAQAKAQLPKDAQPSIIKKTTGSTIDLMYIGFNSKILSGPQITDYISRVVQPQLQTITGIANVELIGSTIFAMRIWLNTERMAAMNVTPDDVSLALQNNNFIAAPGSTKGVLVAYNVNAETNLHNATDFSNIIVKNNGASLVHLKDVATVKLGAQDYDTNVTFNNKSAVFIGITATPTANPLSIIDEVRKRLPIMEKEFPPSLSASIVYDVTDFIRASMREVIITIIEASLIVILVIFVFLGSIRSVIIPIITIPLSLVGVGFAMLALGFSINLLTMLAMVLAIGLVVDDAIVVVENVERHIEDGFTPFNAAIIGAREIALPIISMTITLAAVYAPIGFMGGLTGSLFTEFAFTLASAVIISGIIALTLSPMMCSKFLKTSNKGKFSHYVDHQFNGVKGHYEKLLHNVLGYRPLVLLVGGAILCSIYFLYVNTQSELAPTEDQSAMFVAITGPDYANIDYMTKFTAPLNTVFKGTPGVQQFFMINGYSTVNTAFGGIILKPWEQRSVTQDDILPDLQDSANQLAGVQAAAFPIPPLPVSGSILPIQFVISTTHDFGTLYKASQVIYEQALNSGLFLHVENSLRFDSPQLNITIDADKAGAMGLSRSAVGSALSNAIGGNYINFFDINGQSYQVIPQVLRRFRLDPQQLLNIYIKNSDNQPIPLSTIADVKQVVQPNNLARFQQLNSATLQGLMIPGKTIGDGINYLQKISAKALGPDYKIDYAGQSRQYVEEGNSLLLTFFLSIIIIFLVLAAQFESFRDPLIILVTVPMSICGALIFLNLGFATINIYTQIGLITLVGLISKHGILMVDFANHLRAQEHLDVRAAIEKAAAIRLRPILMTTGAMVLGLIPLLFARGAGASSRFDIGLVIVTGMLIGTFFTLFVLPTIYTFVAAGEAAQPSDSDNVPI